MRKHLVHKESHEVVTVFERVEITCDGCGRKKVLEGEAQIYRGPFVHEKVLWTWDEYEYDYCRNSLKCEQKAAINAVKRMFKHRAERNAAKGLKAPGQEGEGNP